MTASDDLESVLGRAVAAALGGVATQHDDGSSDSMYDVRITTGNRAIALEVTTVTDSVGLDFHAAFDSHRRPGPLRLGWAISVSEGRCNVKKLFRDGLQELHTLEVRGVTGFDINDSCSAQDRAVTRLWDEYGILYGDAVAGLEPGLYLVGHTVGASDWDRAAEIVEREAMKADNIVKLQLAEVVAERHLAVGILETAELADRMSMSHGVLPTSSPELPDTYDAAWLAEVVVRKGEPVLTQLWRWSRPGVWTTAEVGEHGR